VRFRAPLWQCAPPLRLFGERSAVNGRELWRYCLPAAIPATSGIARVEVGDKPETPFDTGTFDEVTRANGIVA
jgi:hypothetical protein